MIKLTEKQRPVLRSHVVSSVYILGFIFGYGFFPPLDTLTEENKEKDSPNTVELKREADDLERRQKNYLLVVKILKII